MKRGKLVLFIIIINALSFNTSKGQSIKKDIFFSNIKHKYNIDTITKIDVKPKHINFFPLLSNETINVANYCQYDSVNIIVIIKIQKYYFSQKGIGIDTFLINSPSIIVYYYNKVSNFIIRFNNYTEYFWDKNRKSYTVKDLISNPSMVDILIEDEFLNKKCHVLFAYSNYLKNSTDNSSFYSFYNANNGQSIEFIGNDFVAEQFTNSKLSDFFITINKFEKKIISLAHFAIILD